MNSPSKFSVHLHKWGFWQQFLFPLSMSIIAVLPLKAGSISGQISYIGDAYDPYIDISSKVVNVSLDSTFATAPVGSASLVHPMEMEYRISNLQAGEYYVWAYLDANDNGAHEEDEPFRVYRDAHDIKKVIVPDIGEVSDIDIAIHDSDALEKPFMDVTALYHVGLMVFGRTAKFVDIDNDGDLDIFVGTYYNSMDPITMGNRLFLNRYPLPFQDISVSAGLFDIGSVRGAAFFDMENDGDLDIFASVENNSARLLANDGTGSFTDVSELAGVGLGINGRGGAAFADVDLDGDLDIFAGNFNGPNRLYLNNGEGIFNDNAGEAGVGISASNDGGIFADVDGDGDADLYTTQWNQQPNRLYENNGDGSFTDITKAAGVGGNNWTCMAVFSDIDSDGDLDLYVVNFSPDYSQADILYRNLGDIDQDGHVNFADITVESGIMSAGNSTGAVFEDFDNDGDVDLLVSTDGSNDRVPGEFQKNMFYINDGSGVFERHSNSGIAYMGNCTGLAAGDYDGDGNVDAYIYTNGDDPMDLPSSLFQNNLNSGEFLKIRLVGVASNHMALGAKTKIYRAGHLGEDNHLLGFRELSSGSFIATAPEMNFGLGDNKFVDVKVIFPSRTIRDTTHIASGGLLVLREDYKTGIKQKTTQNGPRHVLLVGNYPNPFNASTIIRYNIPRAAIVTLQLFNLQGHKVRNLEAGPRPAGNHQVIWEGTDDAAKALPSGVYFYRLQVGEDVVMNKAILIR